MALSRPVVGIVGLSGGASSSCPSSMDDVMPSEEPLRPLIDVTIPPVWQTVRSIRQRVDEALADHTSELRVAAVMTFSELVENAIKYGAAGPADIRVSLGVSSTRVQIEVVNACANQSAVHELRARIDEIERSPDKQALFLQQLMQAIERPTGSGNLGLYRIALEGEFALDCRHETGMVTVSATRAIESGER